jgi:hypothetical protein
MSATPLTIEQLLTTAVRDVLNVAPRPVPSTVPIRAAMDIEPVERPYIVAIAGGGESSPHPKIRRLQLTLRVRSQIDATTSALSGQHLNAAAKSLVDRHAALATILNTAGLRILVWRPAEFGDEQEDERGRFQDLAWAVTLAEALPAPPPPPTP